MDLESILISEIKWSENDKYYMILLNMESNEQINKQNRKKSQTQKTVLGGVWGLSKKGEGIKQKRKNLIDMGKVGDYKRKRGQGE